MSHNVNFYLRKPNPGSGQSLIYLQFKYRCQRLIFTFNQTVDPDQWNKKRQRLKVNGSTTIDGSHLINDILDNLQRVCINAYNKEIANGIPHPSILRKALNDFLDRNLDEQQKQSEMPTLFDLIDRFISGEIQFKGRDKRESTLKGYKTSKHSLLSFQKEMRYPVTYETITLDFFYKYLHFLKRKGLAHNSVAKRVRTLKAFMNEAFSLGYTTNIEFRQKKFSVPEKEVDSVYLNEDEILTIYNHDFSYSKRLEQVRDLFVFGCCVGLRYSDYSNIQPENVISISNELYIQVKAKKTDIVSIIPCHPLVLEIFSKYSDRKNNLPPSISSVKFNLYIKEVCKMAGITQKGCLISDPSIPKYNAVSSHTARRSFCTNLYVAGFPIVDLMRVSGHKNTASFLRYIKITNLDTAIRLSQHLKKTWNPTNFIKSPDNKLVRVA